MNNQHSWAVLSAPAQTQSKACRYIQSYRCTIQYIIQLWDKAKYITTSIYLCNYLSITCKEGFYCVSISRAHPIIYFMGGMQIFNLAFFTLVIIDLITVNFHSTMEISIYRGTKIIINKECEDVFCQFAKDISFADSIILPFIMMNFLSK